MFSTCNIVPDKITTVAIVVVVVKHTTHRPTNIDKQLSTFLSSTKDMAMAVLLMFARPDISILTTCNHT